MFDTLFDPKMAKLVQDLFEQPDTRFLVARTLGKTILLNQEIIPSNPTEQLLAIFSTAHFSESEEECVYVAGVFFNRIRTTDILPYISEHSGKDLAERCLVSLSLFSQAIEERQKRHGCPSAQFYRETGKRAFRAEIPIVAEHFEKWEAFASEIFAI